METPRSRWFLRRTLFVPTARLAYLWNRASWTRRAFAIAAMLISIFLAKPNPPEMVFGVPISHLLLRMPPVLLQTGILLAVGVSHLRRDLSFRALARLRHPRADAIPVVANLYRDGIHLGEDEGFAWVADGRLFFDGQRFSAGFSAQEADESELQVEIGRPLRISSVPADGWQLRFHPQRDLVRRSGHRRPSLNAQLREWRADRSSKWSGTFPPDQPQPVEPWFFAYDLAGGQVGTLMALFFFVLAGAASAPGAVRAVSAVLVLPCLILGFGSGLRAKRAAGASDQARRSVFEVPPTREAFIPTATAAEPETVHHRA